METVDFKKIKKINKSIDSKIKLSEKYKIKHDKLIEKIEGKIGKESNTNFWTRLIETEKLTEEQKEKYYIKLFEYSEKAFPSFKFNNLDLSNEELKFIDFSKIPISDMYSNLDFSNNNLDSLENLSEKYNYKIDNNPIAKKIIPYRSLDEKRIQKEKSMNKDYEIYIIPKGTLMFRQYHSIEDVQGSFVGYKLKEDDGNYYLHPEHRTFGLLYPTFKTKFAGYGEVDTITILQNDVKVFTSCHNSKQKYYQKCDENISKTYNEDDRCLSKELKDKEIMGWICPCQGDNYSLPCSSIINIKNLENLEYKPKVTSQIQLYPRKIRHLKDIITKQEDFDESWMKKNLPEFNYKPFMIFGETATPEEYKSIFDKLLSPEGFTNSDGTFHVTVNKIDGTYVLAEEATKKTLNDCVSLKEDRLIYLKEYIENQ